MNRLKARIEGAYERGEWNEVDYQVWEHKYNLRDLGQWPFDAVRVPAGGNHYYLGSLKSACSLETFSERFGHGIDVVVSCCAEELQTMKGGPGSWRLYFQSQEVKSLQFAMRDVPVRSGADAATFLEEARQTANAWCAVAAQLLVCRQQAHEGGACGHRHPRQILRGRSCSITAWRPLAHIEGQKPSTSSTAGR